MGKRKQSNEKLYEVVQQVSKDTKPQEIEGLLLQVCTRIKNQEPLTEAMVQDGYPAWDHILLEIFRNLRRSPRLPVLSDAKKTSSTGLQTIKWSKAYIPALKVILSHVVKKITHGNPDNSDLKEDKSYIDAWFELPKYPSQYASIGFSKKNGNFYWCVPNPPSHKLHYFQNVGYYKWRREIYKDIKLANKFFSLSSSEQEKWFVSYISQQIQEFDRLFQTSL